MSTIQDGRALPSADDVFAALPEPHASADARSRIRAANRAVGRRIAVLDDDPTGSQTVHDVAVVTVLDRAEYAAGLADAGSTCFVLTNTRSLTEADAVAVNRSAGRSLFELGDQLGGPVQLISRSDSTLRGHVIAEVRALDAARRDVTGRGYDGVLLIPAFFEAGRVTAGDIHWARVGSEWLPAGETEFARDASFGYTASDLKDFVAEKSGGARSPQATSTASASTTSASAVPSASPRSSGASATARSSSSTPRSTATWKSSSSDSRTPNDPAGRSCPGPVRRSCAPSPDWSRGPRSPRRTSGRQAIPAATDSSWSARTSG